MSRAGAGLRRKQRQAGTRRHIAQAWLSLLAVAAVQQTPQSLEQLEVALWPEFDRPAVLVIYRYQLPAAATLPATVALPVPPQVSELHALAYIGPTGELLTIPDYSVLPGEGWSTARFSSPARQGQLEFYAELTVSGDQRSFRFDWPGGVPLNSFGYEVQQPLTATEFSIEPAPGSQTVGQDGLIHYFGSLQTSGSADVVLSYLKADDQLSVDSPPSAPPPSALGPPTSPASGGLDLQSALPWVVGALGTVLLGAGVVWYLRLARPASAPSPGRAPRRRRREGAETEASPIYCHNCGTRAGPSDVYCRQCGTKLRGR